MREFTFTVCYIQGWGRGFQHHIMIGNIITSLQKTRFRVKYTARHLVRAGDGIHSRSVRPKIRVHPLHLTPFLQNISISCSSAILGELIIGNVLACKVEFCQEWTESQAIVF